MADRGGTNIELNSQFSSSLSVLKSRPDLLGFGEIQLGVTSSPHVLSVSYQLKMPGIDAAPVLAKMVWLKTLWDRASIEFVEESVCLQGPIRLLLCDQRVARRPDVSDPAPAWCRVSAVSNFIARFKRFIWTASRIVSGAKLPGLALDVAAKSVRLRDDHRQLTAAALAVAVRDRIVAHAASLSEVVGERGCRSPRSPHSIPMVV